jgi:hypothetical protein
MTPARLLAAHGALHLLALAGLLVGAILEKQLLVQIGAGAGLAGALLYAAFFVHVLMKVRNHGNTYPPSQPAPA